MVIPFGSTNPPSTLMCLMNSIFNKYLDQFVLILTNDILIYSKSEEEHLQHLIIVLQHLRDHQLYAKFEKYELFKNEIYHLGDIISERGITVDM